MERQETLEYVAELSQQLADLAREHSRAVAAALELAALLALEKLAPTR